MRPILLCIRMLRFVSFAVCVARKCATRSASGQNERDDEADPAAAVADEDDDIEEEEEEDEDGDLASA